MFHSTQHNNWTPVWRRPSCFLLVCYIYSVSKSLKTLLLSAAFTSTTTELYIMIRLYHKSTKMGGILVEFERSWISSAEKFSSAAFAELLNVQAECANQSAEGAEHECWTCWMICWRCWTWLLNLLNDLLKVLNMDAEPLSWISAQ